MDSGEFVSRIRSKLKDIEKLLRKVLDDGQRIEGEALEEEGFLFKKYSLKVNRIDHELLDDIKGKLEKVREVEVDVERILSQNPKLISDVENDYNAYEKADLKFGRLFKQYINEAFRNSKHAQVRAEDLKRVIEDGENLHRKSLGKEVKKYLDSLERTINQTMKFVDFIEQLEKKFEDFEKKRRYDKPRTYGRAVGKREYKNMSKEGKLSSAKDPTPVFDSPRKTIKKLTRMSRDELKNFFSQIGVRQVHKVVFFETDLKPVNAGNPIPQSNGLREYKFPKGIRVEILKAA